jgi:hypothetical protein
MSVLNDFTSPHLEMGLSPRILDLNRSQNLAIFSTRISVACNRVKTSFIRKYKSELNTKPMGCKGVSNLIPLLAADIVTTVRCRAYLAVVC